MPDPLSKQQILRLVNRYIGVNGGYLGDFTYRTHTDFYPEFCGLDHQPDALPGTTRERFINILADAQPQDQAKILRGVLKRFPVGASGAPETRTADLASEFERVAAQLDGLAPVQVRTVAQAARAVEEALGDADVLLREAGALNAYDRTHTAFQGYLEQLAHEAGITVPKDSSVAAIFGLLRRNHPKLRPSGGQAEHADRVLKALGALLDPMQPLRSRGSLVHPNPSLLEEPEAMLAINACRTAFRYIQDKLR